MNTKLHKGSREKQFFFSGQATKRGTGEVRAWQLNKLKKVSMATKFEGGGGKALDAGPLKTFFAASLSFTDIWRETKLSAFLLS